MWRDFNLQPPYPTGSLRQMRCFRMRGKKMNCTPIRPSHHADGPTNDPDTALTTMTDHQWLARLRMVHHTDEETLIRHVQTFTLANAVVFTDEWQSYNHILHVHTAVCHGEKEWARDDNGDGMRKVHVNTTEGMWTTVRNFLQPLHDVHKKYLSGYVAMCEFGINLKRITPAFISALVALH